jgi:hypothetical protein
MTPSRRGFEPGLGPESIGGLLARVRLASGKSQLRVAEQLCAASGVPTVTRHEVSRWEREERIPSPYWLRWLAMVLEVPLDDLEQAAALSRVRRGDLPGPGPGDLPGPGPGDLPGPGDVPGSAGPVTGRAGLAVEGLTVSPAALADRIATLRRMDDLVGGADLAPLVRRELTAALRPLRAGAPARRHLLPGIAELAQLTCWVAADAGAPALARRAHRIGVEAATAAGAYPLLGHLLGGLAHLGTGHQPPRAAELARQGYRLARPGASATTRTLLLHRVAFAAARAGQRRACEQALAGAERAFERRDPGADPPWLYWFNDAELTAMTGRCYAALGRPRLAEPLLRTALADPRIRLRARALYAGWLAAAYLDAGDVERACASAGGALLTAVRVGSVRALNQVTVLHPRLRGLRTVPAVRDYAAFYRSARAHLPRSPGADAGSPGADAGSPGGEATARAGCG